MLMKGELFRIETRGEFRTAALYGAFGLAFGLLAAAAVTIAIYKPIEVNVQDGQASVKTRISRHSFGETTELDAIPGHRSFRNALDTQNLADESLKRRMGRANINYRDD